MSSPYSEQHKLQDAVLKAFTRYPGEEFFGRGIVICAGGARLFTCVWVLLRVLRAMVGCRLPVEVWHLGPSELDPKMVALLKTQDAEPVDALAIPGAAAKVRGGWELKPFAIIHSRFREVILLDADNVAVRDPALLFETPEYRATGAVFWPDIERTKRDSPIWEICRVAYRDEPEFESGQIVVDKARCWAALAMTMHLNENSRFYYRYLNGDKDTFRMAWHMVNQPYSMPPEPPRLIHPYPDTGWPEYWGPVLGQLDFAGDLMFQHRNHPKWILFGTNPHYPHLRFERECLAFLDELAGLWDGRVSTLRFNLPEPAARERWYRYVRLSSDERLLELLPDGRIGQGSGGAEVYWRETRRRGVPEIEILGRGFVTCRLARQADGIFRGCWNYNERMPIELVPLTTYSRPGPGIWQNLRRRLKVSHFPKITNLKTQITNEK